jgi:hypothetical protein
MKFEKIFTTPDAKLKNALRCELIENGYTPSQLHNKPKFLYAEGNAPYMLVAHLDTVHKSLPSIICYSKDGNYMMSPQGIGGDDRCGVYIILELLNKLPYKPYVLFTMDEEVGGIGAQAFMKYIVDVEIPDLKYIVEYDRKGNKDCVFYHCDNKEFVEFVEGFGFDKAYGTFSDISIIAPDLEVAAVNISSGYYNPHTEHEYVDISDMNTIIEKSIKMLTAECEKFEYIEQEYQSYYSGYSSYSSYNRRIDVTFLPAESVWVYSWTAETWFVNEENEIAIDEYGNYYRYDKTYKDLVSLKDVMPEDDFVPTYDPDNTKNLRVWF